MGKRRKLDKETPIYQLIGQRNPSLREHLMRLELHSEDFILIHYWFFLILKLFITSVISAAVVSNIQNKVWLQLF